MPLPWNLFRQSGAVPKLMWPSRLSGSRRNNMIHCALASGKSALQGQRPGQVSARLRRVVVEAKSRLELLYCLIH